MNRLMRIEKWAVIVIFAFAASGTHAALIRSTALPTNQLIAGGVVPNAASIAYDPSFGLYYGSRAGNPDYTAAVWDASGSLQQTISPMNADARGWNYNSNTGDLELVTFTSDLLSVGRDASGNLTGAYTTVFSDMPGSASGQSMMSYNSGANTLYSMSSGPTVNAVDRSTGTLSSTIALDFSTAGISTLNRFFIGYDSAQDLLIGAAGNSAYVFGLDGSYIGSSLLSLNTLGELNAGYANSQLFVYDNQINGFQGFDIFSDPDPTDVPVPATLALIGLGLAGLGLKRRKKAQARTPDALAHFGGLFIG